VGVLLLVAASVALELLVAAQHGEPRLRRSSGEADARKMGGTVTAEVGEIFLVLALLLLLFALTQGEGGEEEEDAIVNVVGWVSERFAGSSTDGMGGEGG